MRHDDPLDEIEFSLLNQLMGKLEIPSQRITELQAQTRTAGQPGRHLRVQGQPARDPGLARHRAALETNIGWPPLRHPAGIQMGQRSPLHLLHGGRRRRGDNHVFTIKVEDIRPKAEPAKYPRVVDRQGAAPEQYRSW